MRAVRTNAFLWAAVAAIAALHEAWALPAAIVGFLLAVVPALFAPRLIPTDGNRKHQHAGTTYRLHSPLAPQPPDMPTPESPYSGGSGS